MAGVPVHVVAARLGHADPAITLRVYAHVVRSAETAAADVFAKAIKVTHSVTHRSPSEHVRVCGADAWAAASGQEQGRLTF
ncbi:hypothetical protein NE236_09920 [Actinoallomurus purpureus]|uniref:hypothetical protein n=1 Tax=Actinoallomurus purpureus TaxID=478114 RepID=UPI002093D7CA|nr:hypothetical protein [Actinoallomurus purpureus]MCO6005303.1 hypothetical protein [Actinoallomurus purpureus]